MVNFEAERRKMLAGMNAAYSDTLAQAEVLGEKALAPLRETLETAKKGRRMTDPLKTFAAMSGAKATREGEVAKGVQASGMGGGAAFQAGIVAGQGRSESLARVLAQRDEMQNRNAMAAIQIAGQMGGISSGIASTAIGAGATIQSSKWTNFTGLIDAQAKYDAQRKAASMGLLGGFVKGLAGSDWFGDIFKDT